MVNIKLILILSLILNSKPTPNHKSILTLQLILTLTLMPTLCLTTNPHSHHAPICISTSNSCICPSLSFPIYPSTHVTRPSFSPSHSYEWPTMYQAFLYHFHPLGARAKPGHVNWPCSVRHCWIGPWPRSRPSETLPRPPTNALLPTPPCARLPPQRAS